MTPELKAKMAAGRAAKTAERRAAPKRVDMDAAYHERLASALGVRLPPPGEALTTARMERFLHRCGKSATWYKAETNEPTLSWFSSANPGWSGRDWAGIVCEMVARERKVEAAPAAAL